MAFSTIYGYSQDSNPVTKHRSDAALKRYESVTDPRAFSMEPTEKSNFIRETVASKSGVSSSDDCSPQSKLSLAVMNVNVLSKDDLVKQIKTKDVELDKIHKLFKQATKKLEDMNDIIKDNRKFESQLKDSETQLQKLKHDQQEKEENIAKMKREMEELRCNSSVQMETEQAFNEIKNRAGMFDEVVKERNALKNQLCKMVGISEVLKNLKTRADAADVMEQEIVNLKRELQRYGYGAGGDDNVPNRRVDSACRQCHSYADELSRKESLLEAEIKKNVETEAERNFLRERVRAIDVMEAELIFYKTQQEESECKLMKLKEALIRADMSDNKVRELSTELETIVDRLKESERHAGDLTNTIERQELELKEREVYIGSLNKRMQQEFSVTSPKSVTSLDNLAPGKVQSIVQQLSFEPRQTNCKCGIDNCKCGNVTKTGSMTSKQSQTIQKRSCNPAMSRTQSTVNVKKSKTLEDVNRLHEEVSSDEIQLLRRLNDELDKEVKLYKCELEKMMNMMSELEKQRESNSSLEHEVTEINCCHQKEMKIMQDELHASFRSSICEKDDELCELKKQLNDEVLKSEQLENKLNECCTELQELRPLVGVKSQCEKLNEKLSCVEKIEIERSSVVEGLQGDCQKFCCENTQLKKQLQELEIDLEEQRKYAKSLADQLCNRRNQNEKPTKEDTHENREILRKCVKDLKKHYNELKMEKVEMIQCYELKLQQLEAQLADLKCKREKNLKKCDCEWSMTGDSYGDVLIQKLARFGLETLQRDELIDLHLRVRSAMMKLKQSPQMDVNVIPIDYYTKIADDLRVKYNLSDALPMTIDPENIPVKDFDMCSSKTFPSILRSGGRKSCKPIKLEPRARSSETSSKSREKVDKCVRISHWQPKN